MFITGKHIPRRAMLRGLGVSLALPLLDSMIPALQPLAKAAAIPKVPRFAGIFSPHGWAPQYWQLPQQGALTEYPFVLKPVEAWREHITLISGLDATSSMPPAGMAGGDHSRSAAVFSGVPPKKTVSDDIYLGTTIDQTRDRGSKRARHLPLGVQLRVRELGIVVRPHQTAAARGQSSSSLRTS